MTAILDYLEMLTDNPTMIIGVVVAVLVIGMIILFITRRGKRQKEIKTGDNEKGTVKTESETPLIEIGKGDYKAAVIRNPLALGRPAKTNIIDFTRITEQVGENKLAEPSCVMAGDIFTVRELADGSIVDYEDAREIEIVTENTPEMAFWAIVWKEIKDAIGAPDLWYRNSNIWFVVGVLVILFFVVMLSLDIK
jgi:Ca2+/Na+ antiporter